MKLQFNHLKTFAAIKAFLRQKKYPPSQRDLMELTGVRSQGTICRHLITLEAEGCIRRNNGVRAIELTGIEPDPRKEEEPVMVVKSDRRSLYAKTSQRNKSKWHTENAVMPKLTKAQLQANIDKVVAKAKAQEGFRQDHDIIHDYRSRFSGNTLKAHKL